MEEPLVNGSDIHFYYNNSNEPGPESTNNSANGSQTSIHQVDQGTTSSKKKKKKKSKSKQPSTQVHATLNNPHDEYPVSRVIKQGPNGDVIVESLDDDHSHHHPQNNRYHNIWDSASIEEQENLKLFWESLGHEQKMDLVRIDKKSIMDLFRQENRAKHNHSGNDTASNGTNLNNSSQDHCACKYCGRRSNVIEDELDNIYDNHFDDIIDFIHEVRDINDLNDLPGLLFGGFHVLEEEHKLQKRQHRMKQSGENQVPAQLNKLSISDDSNHMTQHEVPSIASVETSDTKQILNPEAENLESNTDETPVNNQSSANSGVFPLLPDQKLTDSKNFRVKFLGPMIFHAISKLDSEQLQKLRSIPMLDGIIQEYIKSLPLSSEKQAFTKSMSDALYGVKISDEYRQDLLNSHVSEQFSESLSNIAEDLIKNDGNTFLEMMETLSQSRTVREDLLREKISFEDKLKEFRSDNPSNADDEHEIHPDSCIPETHNQTTASLDTIQNEGHETELGGDQEFIHDNHDHDIHESHYDEDEEEGTSDTESEISEEEKMQEIRRLFLIQVIKIFQERLKNAYKEKLAEDRTQKLIEELEAEENAKKERELKKLKQKEKAKEKKRLLQLAKEEERKKKEEEDRAKEEELREKQLALKEEQKRRKEEARLKREEEKRKRIEELKRKEEQQKKKLEAQRKKQEETRRLKEEKKRLAEEERKRREEEKKLREEERRKREQDREQLRLEKEISVAIQEQEAQAFAQEVTSVQNQAPDQKPTTNHLLDQLYHAKPKSNSTTPIASQTIGSDGNLPSSVSNFGTKLTSSPPALLANPATDGLNMSPNTRYASSINSGMNGNTSGISPWANQANLSSTPQIGTTNLMQPPIGNNTFNLFGSEPLNPLSSNPMGNTGRGQSMWSQNSTSRNNSIWSNNINSNSMTSTTPNLANNSLWVNGGSQISNLSTSLGNMQQPSEIMPEKDLVETATYQAFQVLHNSNQLEYGVAPLLSLFQNVKSILNNHSITLNQFLSLIRSSNLYQIDFIYDDFGTVTHVKIALPATTIMTQSVMLLGPPPAPGLSTNFGLGTNDGFLNSSANGYTRGLWN
jgi:hypothetical protein